MPLGTKVIKRTVSKKGGEDYEFAYYSEDMLDDKMAIREIHFYSEEGERMTAMSVRCDGGEYTREFHIYFGSYLAPIQAYRIAKDITDLYDFYNIEDFVEVLENYLCNEMYSTYNAKELSIMKRMNDDIKEFFEKIHQE